ncbi:MAG TPA: hypothetical protein VE912_24310 [Bacteroidales bacterium]|nr:hypothetical protein [Bacteroidales bacterium]
MKKLLFLLPFLFSISLYGQYKDASKFYLDADVGMSMPVVGTYLRQNASSGPYIGLNMALRMRPLDVFIGGEFDYLPLYTDGINFFTPHLGLTRRFNMGKMNFSPTLTAGYTFMRYTLGMYLDPAIPVTNFKEGNVSAGLSLRFIYDVNQMLHIGLGDSFLHIFDGFGAGPFHPDDSRSTGLNRVYVSVVADL